MLHGELPIPKDDADRKLLADVGEHGWHVVGIEEDDEGPGYAFSVGLYHNFAHPEILIMGLRTAIAHQLINLIGEAVRGDKKFQVGMPYKDIAAGPALAFIPILERHYRDYLGYACWFYRGDQFPALQCVWPDKQGVFPWEPGFDGRFFQQQRLLGPAGELTQGWLFGDPPNVATFTVREIVHDGQPILVVVHDDEDGAWQFLTGDDVATADAMVVSLVEMVRRDASLLELINLPTSWRALRRAVGEPWQREPIDTSGNSGEE